MPRCLQCNKSFKSLQRVLSHMNQPSGSCRPDFTCRLIRVSDQLKPYHRPAATPQHGTTTDDTTTHHESIPVEDFYVPNALSMSDKEPDGIYTEEYVGAAKVVTGAGKTFIDEFNDDKYAQARKENIFYPFASRDEWQMGSFLLRSNLSMSAIDDFLSLELVKQLQLSFRTAKELRGRIEMLPAGPTWSCKPLKSLYSTKKPLQVFYRDSLECVRSIVHNPLVKDHLHFEPLRLFKTAEKLMRVYTEWRTGNAAWEMQNHLPPGAALLGIILSSDKTTISIMTGNRTAHPLLLSLANIDMDFRSKASHHAYVLLALLPVPKFLVRKQKLRGVLEARLIHECLDIVLDPLKKAAKIGVMMSDPLGNVRYCFTPLAAYIVDTPEAALMACVGGKTSSVTMASYRQFGDPFRHEPRTSSTTLAQLSAIESETDPWNLTEYIKEAAKFRLSGVHRPFWRDWPLSDPSTFLTPEPLHHWHKFFWDHDVKWCVRVVSSAEIDYRFSLLHPHTGYRRFSDGISTLKQVTGRDHREIQRYLIAVIAGAVPPRFLIAIRALMDFRYLAQALVIDEDTCLKVEAALSEFHDHKDSILTAKARCGKGNKPIDNWYIPKLEFFQSVGPEIRANGAPSQWSADLTEHAHITEIKEPARSTNNQNYEAQICRHLDRRDKCQRFDLATSVRDASVDFRDHTIPDDHLDTHDGNPYINTQGSRPPHTLSTTASLLTQIKPVSSLSSKPRAIRNYFQEAEYLRYTDDPKVLRPFRTFANTTTAFHLTRDARFKRRSIHDIARDFGLVDLRCAIADYLHRITNGVSVHSIGGRRTAVEGCYLPFDQLDVWTEVRLQSKAYHCNEEILPPQTVNAAPQSEAWPFGQCDTVVVNTDPNEVWPHSGLQGHHIGQLRLIMRAALKRDRPVLGMDKFLVYVQRFDIIPQSNPSRSGTSIKGPFPDPASTMYAVKRARRSDNSVMGDVIPLEQLRSLVDLVPCFGKTADSRLTQATIMEYSTEFWVNKYFTKELFWAMN